MVVKALVLEEARQLSLREIDIHEETGPGDVRVKVRTVGICGSDVHYYLDGRMGPAVVKEPLVLGHEGSGTVVETGADVTDLAVGERVCMEPGIPDPASRATRLGIYNLDPGVRFWAVPPVHGCLRETVVHPARFTYRLPDNVGFAEGAMTEPLAVGLNAVTKAKIVPGEVAVVLGAGPIGAVTTLAALAGGAGRVVLADLKQARLDLIAQLGPVTPVNVGRANLADVVRETTDGWGADVVFECSGNEEAAAGVLQPLCPGGRVVLVGTPVAPLDLDVIAAQSKEATIKTVFRYAHQFDRALSLMAGGKIDVRGLVTDTFPFEDAVRAFEFAAGAPEASVKIQIEMPG